MPQLSEGDRQAIAAGVHASGGQSKTFLTREVTHFITPSATGVRTQPTAHRRVRRRADFSSSTFCRLQEMYELLMGPVAVGAKIEAVLPHWIDACLSLGTLVDSRPYAFPDPAVLEHPAAGKPPPTGASVADLIPPSHQTLLRQMAGREELIATPTPAAAAVWRGRKLRFSEDLDVDAARREGWTEAVRLRAGEVVDRVEDADVVICRYREGRDYNQVRPPRQPMLSKG